MSTLQPNYMTWNHSRSFSEYATKAEWVVQTGALNAVLRPSLKTPLDALSAVLEIKEQTEYLRCRLQRPSTVSQEIGSVDHRVLKRYPW